MTGYIRCEAGHEQAAPNQNFAGADYQPTVDSASVTNLFREIPEATEGPPGGNWRSRP
jgi:hypothetical protein